jgi:hypothetical protein
MKSIRNIIKKINKTEKNIKNQINNEIDKISRIDKEINTVKLNTDIILIKRERIRKVLIEINDIYKRFFNADNIYITNLKIKYPTKYLYSNYRKLVIHCDAKKEYADIGLFFVIDDGHKEKITLYDKLYGIFNLWDNEVDINSIYKILDDILKNVTRQITKDYIKYKRSNLNKIKNEYYLRQKEYKDKKKYLKTIKKILNDN